MPSPGIRIRSASSTYVAVALVQRGLNILILPLMTRALGPDDFGTCAVLVAGSLLFTVILGSAIENAVFRWGAEDHADSSAVLWASRMYALVLVPVAGVLGAGLFFGGQVDLLGVSAEFWAVELLAVSTASAFSYFALPLLRSRERLRLFVCASLASIVTVVGLKLGLVVAMDLGVRGWVLADLGGGLVGFGMTLLLTRSKKVGLAGSGVRTVLAYSLPLIPHRTAFWAMSFLDRPLLAALAPMTVVGVYSLAASLSAVGVMVIGEFNRGLLLSYARSRWPAAADRDLVRVLRVQLMVLLWVPLFLSLGIALTHPLLLGPGFAGALLIVACLIPTQVFYGLYLFPTNLAVQTLGQTDRAWRSSACGAVVLGTLVVALSREWGGVGVAIASSISYAVMAAVAFLALGKAQSCSALLLQSMPPPGAVATAVAGLSLGAGALLAPSREWQVGLVALGFAALCGSGFAFARASENNEVG